MSIGPVYNFKLLLLKIWQYKFNAFFMVFYFCLCYQKKLSIIFVLKFNDIIFDKLKLRERRNWLKKDLVLILPKLSDSERGITQLRAQLYHSNKRLNNWPAQPCIKEHCIPVIRGSGCFSVWLRNILRSVPSSRWSMIKKISCNNSYHN